MTISTDGEPGQGRPIFLPYKGHWAVYDAAGCLVCVCVYRKGAREVVRRLIDSHDEGHRSATDPQTRKGESEWEN
jgi:hypothetical protein